MPHDGFILTTLCCVLIVRLPVCILDDVLHLIDCEICFLAQASHVDAMIRVVDVMSMLLHATPQTAFIDDTLDAIDTKDSKGYPCLVCSSVVALNSEALRQCIVFFVHRVDNREDRLACMVATLVDKMRWLLQQSTVNPEAAGEQLFHGFPNNMNAIIME